MLPSLLVETYAINVPPIENIALLCRTKEALEWPEKCGSIHVEYLDLHV